MDLLERYLQAVKFWLPRKQQSDILTELSEDIRSEIEEKEAELGRKLNESELGALLKKRGRPMLVAMGYRPKRHLIGPQLFPMYWFVLRLAMACFLIPWAATGIFLLFFGSSSHGIGEVLGSFWGSLWTGLTMQFAIITLVFAGIEHFARTPGVLDDWNPTKLPAVRPAKDPFRVSRICAATEIVFGVIFLLWWIVMPQGFPFSWQLERAGIHWNWGSVWMDFHSHFYYPIILLTLLSLGVNVSNLITARWTRPRLAIRAGINAAVALMAYFVVRAHWPEAKAQFALFDGALEHMPDVQKITLIINLSIYLALAITVIAAGIQSITELVRMVRLNGGKGAMKAAAVALAGFLIVGVAAAHVAPGSGSQTHATRVTCLPQHVSVASWVLKRAAKSAIDAASCAVSQLNRLI